MLHLKYSKKAHKKPVKTNIGKSVKIDFPLPDKVKDEDKRINDQG